MSERLIDLQMNSKLFCLPLEIRQSIYGLTFPHGIHACLNQDRIILSTCVQSSITAIHKGGKERNPFADPELSATAHYLYARRLRSSWGAHWKCEEIAMDLELLGGPERHAHLNVLQVCRRMRADILNFLLNVSSLNITGLNTLRRITSQADTPRIRPSISPGNLEFSLIHIKHLALTVRLSLRTFRLISRYVKGVNTSLTNYKQAAWLRDIKNLVKLPRLQTLSIWVDHDTGSSWSLVNERTFLSPLIELMQTLPALKVTVNLPNIDPSKADFARHYLADDLTPPFVIERRQRQAYFAGMHSEGFYSIHRRKEDSDDSDLECPTCDERVMDSDEERAFIDETGTHCHATGKAIDRRRFEELKNRVERICLKEIKENEARCQGVRTINRARWTRSYRRCFSSDPSDTEDDAEMENIQQKKRERRRRRHECAVKNNWSKDLYEEDEECWPASEESA